MKKIFILVSNIVLVLAFLSAFAWIIKEANNNSELLGKSFDKAIIKWSSFPDKFSRAVEQVQNLPETFEATPESFKHINHLKNDVFALVSFSKSNTSRIIQLKNLRTDSISKNWEIENLDNPHRRVLNPLLYHDNSIVYATIGISGVFCIDGSSKEIWKQKKITGIVDWEYAAIGDPFSDLAVTSLELRYEYGVEGMEELLEINSSFLPIDRLRYSLWLIFVASSTLYFIHEWKLTKDRESSMKKEAMATIEEESYFLLNS